MRNGFRLFLMGALGVALCALGARAADDPKPKGDDDKSKGARFDTLDGVTLDATFWPSDPQAPAKDKDATVLLLHDIGKNGGNRSSQEALAQALSKQGFAVLSFDFRGFGNSKSVSKDFWDPIKGRHNIQYVKGGSSNAPPDTIEHSDFDPRAGEYYPYLVNDIAAAKSYLDRHSGEGGINSSNLILVGSGEGATVGAMWMASQWHLKKVSGIDKLTGKLTLDEPEGRDEAGAVWLSISPTLGNREVRAAVRNWVVDSAAENKLPMAFLYGAKDESGESFAKGTLHLIDGKVRQLNPSLKEEAIKQRLELMAPLAIPDTNLSGSKLLGVDKTVDAITNYAKNVVEARGAREARSHALRREDWYIWALPGMRRIDAKTPNLDDAINLIPVRELIQVTSGG